MGYLPPKVPNMPPPIILTGGTPEQVERIRNTWSNLRSGDAFVHSSDVSVRAVQPVTCGYCGNSLAADRCQSCGAPRENYYEIQI